LVRKKNLALKYRVKVILHHKWTRKSKISNNHLRFIVKLFQRTKKGNKLAAEYVCTLFINILQKEKINAKALHTASTHAGDVSSISGQKGERNEDQKGGGKRQGYCTGS